VFNDLAFIYRGKKGRQRFDLKAWSAV